MLFGAKIEGRESYMIQTASRDGLQVEAIAEFQHEIGPGRVSPDGRRLAFSIADKGEAGGHMRVIDEKGNELAAVEDSAVGCWSPDGRRVAFADYRERTGQWSNALLHVDTGEVATLPVPATDQVFDWCSDGKHLLSVSSREGRQFSDANLGRWSLRQVYRTNADGSDPVRLTDPDNDHLWPRYSAGGSRIALHTRSVQAGQIQTT